MAIFKGNGIVWNPQLKKPLVNFNKQEEFSTNVKNEIDLLELAGAVKIADNEAIVIEATDKELSKKELIQIAKKSGIKGADRMSKEQILEALEA